MLANARIIICTCFCEAVHLNGFLEITSEYGNLWNKWNERITFALSESGSAGNGVATIRDLALWNNLVPIY